jgi:hemerythrin
MSNEFKWSDEYSVGVEEIDAQHKTLFDLLERLREAIHAKHGSAACIEILDELVAYTKVHFTLEESLMRLAHYPDLAAHQQRHRDLVAEVEAMYEKIHNGGGAISFELLHFLRTWLTKHILNEDMRYAEHFATSGFADGKPAAVAPAVIEAAAKAPARRKWWQFW